MTALRTDVGIIGYSVIGQLGDRRSGHRSHMAQTGSINKGSWATPFGTRDPCWDSEPSHHVMLDPSGSHFMGIL